ncbi:MAG: hypothetical protein E7346_03885 [Clostridiales bacterium]|nr:hypothetical protein [Clostridiales bacterium]
MKSSNKNTLNTLSYVALIIVALLILIENVLPLIGINEIKGPLISVLKTVRNMFVLIVIGISAYNFLPGRAKWVSVLFWVAIIVYVVGTILLWFI